MIVRRNRWILRLLQAGVLLSFGLSACQDDTVTLPHKPGPDLYVPPLTRDSRTSPPTDPGVPPGDLTNPDDPGVLPDTTAPDPGNPPPIPGPCDDPFNCPCVSHQGCAQYDPFDLCRAKHQCVNGYCIRPPGPNVECPTDHPVECMTYACHPEWGLCVDALVSDGSPCDDSNLCTEGESCQNQSCSSGTTKNCDDGNLCTTDSCDQTTGLCNYDAVGCSDNNPCTNDSCSPSGACAHEAVNCDDVNACTADSCSPLTGQCSHTTKSCNDGDSCTIDSCDTSSGDCVNDLDPACQVTFAEINAQILVFKCIPCHLPNTTGCDTIPKFVGNYELTQTNPPTINECSSVPGYKLGGCFKVVIEDQLMPPPWNPIGSCWLSSIHNSSSYSFAYGLTPQEKAMIIDWVDGGMVP